MPATLTRVPDGGFYYRLSRTVKFPAGRFRKRLMLFAPPRLATNVLAVALIATFIQQTLTLLTVNAVPLVAPAALPDLGVPATYVGVFMALLSTGKILIYLGCGNVVCRYGGLRVTQVGLLMLMVAMLLCATGVVWLFVAAAMCAAVGSGVTTPSGSHILARYAPPRYAPLIFSAKQTSVPVGLSLGGLAVPFLVAGFGWQGAFVAIGLVCGALAFALQPVRRELDSDRDPSQRLSGGDVKATFLLAARTPPLRRLAIAMFAFVGLQTAYNTYLVLFLTERVGMTLPEAAGGVFAVAIAVSIPTRLFWGWLASAWLGPRVVITGLAFAMAAAAFLTAAYGPDWSYWQILAVAVLFTSTALGWQGVLLAEVARLSPAGRVAQATGGVLSFSTTGAAALPLLFSAILALTQSYALGFIAIAIPALAVGTMMLWRPLEDPPSPAQGKGPRPA